MRNDADAADAMQEAFLRAFRYFDSYRGDDAKSWVLKIVRRTCYSWLEFNRPADVVSLGDEALLDNVIATASTNAEALLESRSDLRHLDGLIEALPAPLREAIVLRELHELGYREIAEVTGAPIGTVMSRLHRARSAAPRVGCDGQRRNDTPLAGARGRLRGDRAELDEPISGIDCVRYRTGVVASDQPRLG